MMFVEIVFEKMKAKKVVFALILTGDFENIFVRRYAKKLMYLILNVKNVILSKELK